MTIQRRGESLHPDTFARQNLGDILAEVHPWLGQKLFDRDIPTGRSGHFETEIRGVVGPDGDGVTCYGVSLFREDTGAMGGDLLDLPAHCRFPLHVHPGHHILLCLRGTGTFTVGGVVHDVVPGDLMMVEGDVPHAVGAGPDGHVLMAIGAPHKPLDSEERMRLVDGSEFAVTQLESVDETAEQLRAQRDRHGNSQAADMGLTTICDQPATHPHARGGMSSSAKVEAAMFGRRDG